MTHRTRIIMALAAAVVVLSAGWATGRAEAASYSLTSGSTVDSAAWDTIYYTGGASVSGGISFSATAGNHLQLLSKKVLTGDFSVTLAFDSFAAHLDNELNAGPLIALSLTNYLPGAWDAEETISVLRYAAYGSGGQEEHVLSTLSSSDSVQTNTTFAPASGSLRIARSGSSVTTSYDSGSGWTTLHTYTDLVQGPCKIVLGFDSGDDTGTFAARAVSLDVTGGTQTDAEAFLWISDFRVTRKIRESGLKQSQAEWYMMDGYGRPWTGDVVSSVALTGPGGSVPLDTAQMEPWTRAQFSANWDSIANALSNLVSQPSMPSEVSYYAAAITGSSSTPHNAGTYTLSVNGGTYTGSTTTSAGFDMPYVLKSSIGASVSSGQIVLSWTLPSSGYVVADTRLYVHIEPYETSGQPAGMRLTFRLPADATSLTTPKWVANVIDGYGGHFIARVRLRSKDGINQADSNWKGFLFKDGTVGAKSIPQRAVVIPLF